MLPSQSLDHANISNGNNLLASYAIDGNFAKNVHSGATCTHIRREAGAWWQVDLRTAFNIIALSITTREYNGEINAFFLSRIVL